MEHTGLKNVSTYKLLYRITSTSCNLLQLFQTIWRNCWIFENKDSNHRTSHSNHRTSLAVQCLELHVSTAGSMGLVPGRPTEIPHATRHGQKKKKTNTNSNHVVWWSYGTEAHHNTGNFETLKILFSFARYSHFLSFALLVLPIALKLNCVY